jgi:catechol 2,3-dioxygenase-like lactoylglutathione lyase family enzyme
MTIPSGTERSDLRRCGCCGRHLPSDRLTELGTTPDVFICAGCALSAVRRTRPLSQLGRLPIIRALRRRHRHDHRQSGDVTARAAIPILPSSDLDRTVAFYAPIGFVENERHPGYLLLHNAGVELHFAEPGLAGRGECFVHVGDARALHNRLHTHGIDSLEPIADHDYGLREFAVTDPDGNRVRFGSPVE